MINPKDYLEMGIKFHGHKCPAQPMGLRAGALAMNTLGVERSKSSEVICLIEIGFDHCATCFADGVQVITGCTFGKGNIYRLNYGKFGVTLIDKKNKKAIRVVPKAEAMERNKKSPFFTEYRMKGIPAEGVPSEIVDPLIESVMNAKDEDLFNISNVFDYEFKDAPHPFRTVRCSVCGEFMLEHYAHIVDGKPVCEYCHNKMMGYDTIETVQPVTARKITTVPLKK